MQNTELGRYQQMLLEMERRGREEFGRIVDVVHDAQAPGEHDQTPSESVEKEYAIAQTEEEKATRAMRTIQHANSITRC